MMRVLAPFWSSTALTELRPAKGATSRACSLGWLEMLSVQTRERERGLRVLLRVAGDDLRDLLLRPARQQQQVVAPVGGGRLVHGTPDQGPGLCTVGCQGGQIYYNYEASFAVYVL